jgi:hypothetical protein
VVRESAWEAASCTSRSGAVAVQSSPVGCGEQRSFGAFADGQVDGVDGAWGERDRDDLASLAGGDRGAVAALKPQVLDVRAGRLGQPKPVEGEKGLGRWRPTRSPAGAAGRGLRAKVSMSARRTENSGRDRVRHQAVNWRRSRV